MTTLDPSLARPAKPYEPPVVAPGHDAGSITDQVNKVVFGKTPLWWVGALGVSFSIVMVLLAAITWLFVKGVGIWGVNVPIAWGFAIVNFVWWIGIGHAGTLISAILLLFRQQWRTSINRFAEAMTLFAVACAGMFPVLHLGRPWVFYWLFPYPNTMTLWPQFRSPLIWDVFAVSTYGTVSLLFWYVGLVPDLATIRDRAKNVWARRLSGVFSLGWRGSAAHWQNYETLYLLLAGLATPLVLSVHTVVSFDFAISIIPGWHTTIFPPYFVAGAIYSGFAMVLTLLLPLRRLFGLGDMITERHMNAMSKVMLATGLIVAYGYIIELFMAWYSAVDFEIFMMKNRISGPYWFQYMLLWLCNILIPQALWSKRVRRSPVVLWIIAVIINVGMWLERYVIVVISLHRDYMPSSWDMFSGTIWDWATFVGTLGFFLSLIFLFVRFLPLISGFEMRHLVSHGRHGIEKEVGASS
ncbi:MAG TPA: NrfD/PsrC family molybdoenzyme membrane anchor subunit [Thermoanaerobaculia bacterium]|nr:NrfD/PsrC family molybdoenzyme membrane anchor subunit [Thermoanaerobaculia bacterium]